MSSTSENPGSAGTSLPDDVEATHRSVKGHLVLSPKFVRHFLNLECRDKQDAETYKEYFERLRGSAFSSKEWKNLCNFTSEILDKSKDLDEMDITVLGYLYNCAFKVKVHQGDTSKVLESITHLKNLRNEVMHSIESVNDPGALAKLEVALQSWIDVAGSFYSLLPNKINELKKELENDIETGFSQGKIKLLYSCACVAKEGRADVQRFVQGNFTNDTLMFGMGQVERSAVFHSLEIRNLGDDNQTFPFMEIFKQSENIVIVSGIAGAGKSTLLENIALQFIQPHSGTSAYLTEFDLLVYVQCRDRTKRSLRDAIEQQFKDVCVKIGYDYVIKAIFSLRVIFLVDGFDECTQSTKVVEEIVRGTNGTSSRLIITSRPNAVARFKHQLSGRSWKEFEIVPLEKIEEQLNFLKKYELHLPGQHSAGALRGSFKTLSAPLRRLFVQPIKLLQFCSVFVTFPDKITKWKLPSDAARDIFGVYKNTVSKKLANLSYPDFDIVIDDLFEVLCDAALDFLRHDKLIFTEEDIKRIQKKCRRKLKDEHEIKDLDTKIVLSSVLKMKMSPLGDEATSFSFHHKTDEEYFASMSVVEKLCDEKINLKNILIGQEMAAPDV